LDNIVKTYNSATKEFERKDNYYPIAKCTEENFKNTDFEKQYYEVKKTRSQYCVEQHKDVYLQGTKDSEILKQDHAYIVFEILRCGVTTMEPRDPVCKPERMMILKDGSTTDSVDIATLIADGANLRLYEEDLEADSIDNWVRLKRASMKIINQKINFITFEENAVRYNELHVPSVPLAYPNYSDTGYRFRFNLFERVDGYILPDDVDNIFFDYFEYNTDTFPSAPEGREN
jgi:hypothetical protein